MRGQFLTPEGFETADTAVGPYYLNDFINQPESDSFTQEFRFSYESDNWSSIVGACSMPIPN